MLKHMIGLTVATMFGATALGAATLIPLPAAAAEKDELGIVMSSLGFLYLPALTAEAMGYFDEQNIDGEITATGGGSKALAAVIGGDADIYVGAISSAFRARDKGTDVITFGTSMTQFGSNFVISGDWAKKHGITAASSYADKQKALKGIKVGVTSPGSGTDQAVRFLAKEAGLDPDRDITIVSLGTGDAMTAALIQGRIDGFTHSAPVGEKVVKDHGGVMLFNTAQGEVKSLDGFFYIGQIASESWLAEHSDLAVRYLRAIQKSLDTMHDPALTAKARDAVHAAYHSKIDKELYDSVWQETLPAFPKSVVITEAQVNTVVDFMNEFDKTPLDPALVKESWTNEYAKQVADGKS